MPTQPFGYGYRARTWAEMTSRERRQAIKMRLAFPRDGWPDRYPPEKDPLRA